MHITPIDRRGMNPATDIKLYKKYRALLRQVKPEAVLTYTIKPNVYGGVACRQEHIPCLANVTGLGSTLQGSGPVKQLIVQMYKAGLRGAACVFFQNEYNLEFMKREGCIRHDAHTRLLAGSGVNLTEHAYQPYPMKTDYALGKLSDDKIHILAVGRIMDDKGSTELLEAIERIHESHQDVVFDILGSYEEETKGKYEPWVNRLCEAGAINYYGFRDDVDNFYKTAHALVHPSYHEGMSNVVQEAAAAGRPVITSNIPGCKEIYEDGVGGISFEPRNTEGLVLAIERFIALSESEREQMGIAARKYVENHFDRKLVTKAYLEEIDKAIDKSHQKEE